MLIQISNHKSHHLNIALLIRIEDVLKPRLPIQIDLVNQYRTQRKLGAVEYKLQHCVCGLPTAP